jgi:hypothetical protein
VHLLLSLVLAGPVLYGLLHPDRFDDPIPKIAGFLHSCKSVHTDSEFADSVLNLPRVDPSVTENQASPLGGVPITRGQGHGGNAVLSSGSGYRYITDVRRQQCNQMHAGFGPDHFKDLAHLRSDCTHKRLATIHVEHSHSADVAREVSLANEIGQDSLIESG